LLAAIVSVATATSSDASHQPAGSPIGRWYAEGGAAQIEISDCAGALCGQVVWLRSPFDENGCDLRDRFNPDRALRARPVLGLDGLRDLHRSREDATSWTGGTIYDPASGNTYRCSLQVESTNRLRLRGYVGIPIIGRTTSWLRVGAERQLCRQND